MDALQISRQLMTDYEAWVERLQSDPDRLPPSETSYPPQAVAWAQIAQAEALERIAAAQERIADALYTTGYEGEVTSIAKSLEELNGNISCATIY